MLAWFKKQINNLDKFLKDVYLTLDFIAGSFLKWGHRPHRRISTWARNLNSSTEPFTMHGDNHHHSCFVIMLYYSIRLSIDLHSEA